MVNPSPFTAYVRPTWGEELGESNDLALRRSGVESFLRIFGGCGAGEGRPSEERMVGLEVIDEWRMLVLTSCETV